MMSTTMPSTTNNDDHLPYEGAGFILAYESDILLGIRIKKPEDLKKDPTVEIEYMEVNPKQVTITTLCKPHLPNLSKNSV